MKSTPLVITQEKVLEAAKQCATAKAVLTTIFPEVFALAEEAAKAVLIPNFPTVREVGTNNMMLERRYGAEYREKGFYLSTHYNWRIVTDREGSQVLVPTKK